MIPTTEELLQAVLPHDTAVGGAETIRQLIALGLINRRAAESHYARHEVERLVRKGRGRCRAMDDVAEKLCCSYEKVRQMVYNEGSNEKRRTSLNQELKICKK